MARTAAAGSVKTHAVAMSTPMLQRTLNMRRVIPTPKMAPVMVCVVLTGIPNHEASKIVRPPPVSAQKPLMG